MKWKVILYESPGGQKPVEKFIGSLQASTRAKLIRQIELLEEFGPDMGMPNVKLLGEGLYEIRVRGRDEVRLIYIFRKKNSIYLLHGFIKKRRAISKNELKVARKRVNNL